MKYLRKPATRNVPPETAATVEAVREVISGQIPDPIAVHLFHPPALEAHWKQSVATYFSGRVSRTDKDIVASGVSNANACSYCAEAHGDLVHVRDRSTASAIRNDDLSLTSDGRRAALYRWGRSTLRPNDGVIRNPPFDESERPEIVGTALMFHYVNRTVNVLLPGSLLPPIPGLRPLFLLVARPTLRKLAAATLPSPKTAASTRARPTWLDWSGSNGAIANSFAELDLVLSRASAGIAGVEVRSIFAERLRAWNGEKMPTQRGWVSVYSDRVSASQRAAAELALRVALDSQRVSRAEVEALRRAGANDSEIAVLILWSAFEASKRIATWL